MAITFTTDPDVQAVGLDKMYVFPASLDRGTKYDNIGKLVHDAAKASSAKGIGAIQTPGLSLSAKLDKLWLIFNESTNTTAAGYAIVADLDDFEVNLFDPDMLGPIGSVLPADANAALRIKRLVYSHNLNPDTRGASGSNLFGFTDAELAADKLNLNWPFGFGAGMVATCEFSFGSFSTEFPLVYKVPGYTPKGAIADPDEVKTLLNEWAKADSNKHAAAQKAAEQRRETLVKQSGSVPKNVAPAQRQASVSLDALTFTFKGMSIELDVTASLAFGPIQGRIINFQVEVFLGDEFQTPALASTSGPEVANLPVRVDIDGLGFAFESPAFSIAGAVMKQDVSYQISDPRTKAPNLKTLELQTTTYNGGLIIKTPVTGFAAIASFAMMKAANGDQPPLPAKLELHDEPSLFLYAMMQSAGGITFYNIVTLSGLALTFGYNRDFKVPSDTGDIPSHPLIALVESGGPPQSNDDSDAGTANGAGDAPQLGGAADASASSGSRGEAKADLDGGGDLDKLIGVLKSLKEFVPITPHNVVAGVGIKGDVAKLVELFLMPVLSFNFDSGDISVQLYGTASLGLPKGVSDDATVLKLNAVLAAEIPITGNKPLMIGLAITGDSFVLRPFVSIEGGLAFYHQREDKQNNVEAITLFTMGGYGPLYRNAKPGWPVTGPVQISMHLADIPSVVISMRGRLYFSFLPDAIAFGLDFQGLAELGGDHFSLSASYDVGAHALMMWAPFFYEVEMHANFALRVRVSQKIGIGWASYTVSKSLSFDLAAKLHMWGNEVEKLNGRAELTVHVLFTFHPTVDWGEPIGNFFPISWTEFKKQFAPHSESNPSALASGQCQVTDGVIDHHGEEKTPVVAPERFEAEVKVFFPATHCTLNGSSVEGLRSTPVGIQMIGLLAQDYSAPVSVSLYKDGTPVDDRNLDVEVIAESVPIALWKPAKHKGMADAPDSKGPTTINDVPIGLRIATTPPTAHASNSVDKRNLQFDIDEGADIVHGHANSPKRGVQTSEAAVTSAMTRHRPNLGVLNALGIDSSDISFAPLKDTDLIGVPHLV